MNQEPDLSVVGTIYYQGVFRDKLDAYCDEGMDRREALRALIDRHGGHTFTVARELGMSIQSVNLRIWRYGLRGYPKKVREGRRLSYPFVPPAA